MANPIVTDVFKFVAVRPAQLADTETTAISTVRDRRVGNPRAASHFTRLLRGLGDPGAATRAWEERDHALLEPLLAIYRQLSKALSIPEADAPEALATTGLFDLSEAETEPLADASFDALYIAYLCGPDAGPRLTGPLLALRVLHAHAHARTGASAATLAAALGARPVIDPSIIAIAGSPPPAPPPPAPHRPERNSERDAMRELIADYDETQRLLGALRRAPLRAPVQTIEGEAPGAFAVSNMARIGDALSPTLSIQSNRLLRQLDIDPATTLPKAALALERHMTDLTARAAGFRSDPQFQFLVADAAIDSLSKLAPIPIFPVEDDPGTAAEVDMSGRIRPLGIGDLKVVKQKLLRYEAGEVAHIENVLKGEFKDRKHRVLDRSESVVFITEEENKESERDTQSTDRFELKKETEATIKEDMSVKAGLTVTGGFGPVTVTAQGDFAYATAKEESEKNSANFARDVVDKSVSKIQKRVKTERTTKTLREVEETNAHGIDNRLGTDHITGVYRWVDKRYRAQVYNYGRRLMLEFIVPEPAAYFRASQVKSLAAAAGLKPPEPFLDLGGQALTANDITGSNYRIFASRYNAAGITPPPPEWTFITTTLDQGAIQDGQTVSKSVKDMMIPDGYMMRYFNARISAVWVQGAPQLLLQVGEAGFHLLNSPAIKQGATWLQGWAPSPEDWDDPMGPVPVTVIGYDINSFAVNVAASCQVTPEHVQKWQLTTFDKIFAAYKALQTEYDQKVAQLEARAGAVLIEGRNPQTNREIEKRELKKLSITMMTGQHFKHFDAMSNPDNPPAKLPEVSPNEALKEGRYIQFFEQAFDWDQLTYLFYPYFWARKSKWVALSNMTDPDPMFAHFLQAGSARVVVPVTPAYNDAVLYFLQKPGPVETKIWSGGPTPTIDDKDGLFVSIADEIRQQTDDLAGAIPEGDPWEFTLPTTLVWLQSDSKLPDYET